MTEPRRSSSLPAPRPPAPPPDLRRIARHRIGTAAAITGVHPQTLREYERRGLLQISRTDGGRRLYSDREVGRARRLHELGGSGVPLAAAQRMIRLEELLVRMFERIHTLEEQNRRLSRRLVQLSQ